MRIERKSSEMGMTTDLRELRTRSGVISLFVGWAALLAACCILAGLGIVTSLHLSVMIFGLSFPLFVVIQSKRGIPTTVAVMLSLSATTVALALLFAFTPISKHSTLVWAILLAAIATGWYRYRTLSRTQTPSKPSPQDLMGLIVASPSLLLVCFMLHRAFPYSRQDPVWVPDDFPFFALLAKDTSAGRPGSAFFSDLDMHYHWLSYALFGGLQRLASVDHLQGLISLAPSLSWLLLALGAIAVVQLLTRSVLAVAIAVTSTLFSQSVGVQYFVTSGLGPSVVSPSTLITSSWFVALIITLHLALRQGTVPVWFAPISLVMGFSLTLAKVSTAGMAFLGVLTMVLHAYFRGAISRRDRQRKLIQNIFLAATPFAVGALAVTTVFIRSTSTDLGIETALLPSNLGDGYTGLVLVLPVLASVFSFAVMVLPTVAAFRGWRGNDILLASGVLALVGLLLVLVFDFGMGNEAWFLTAGLALILPTSSVIVATTISTTLARDRAGRVLQVAALVACLALAVFALMRFGGAQFLLVRPWLTPVALIALSVSFASVWQLGLRSVSGLVPSQRASLALVYLFILSFVLGIGFRLDAAAKAPDRGGPNSPVQFRDSWVRESAQFANRISDQLESSPIAVYSQNPSDSLMTRWIPYLLDTRAYSISPLDDITDYFTPLPEMQRRQATVRDFVFSRNAQACEDLRADGVRYIWITPDLAQGTPSIEKTTEPQVVPVAC